MGIWSSIIMKISTRLLTVPTYTLDLATIVAHIPWISQYFKNTICEKKITDSFLTTHFKPNNQNKARTKLSEKSKNIFERKK